MIPTPTSLISAKLEVLQRFATTLLANVTSKYDTVPRFHFLPSSISSAWRCRTTLYVLPHQAKYHTHDGTRGVCYSFTELFHRRSTPGLQWISSFQAGGMALWSSSIRAVKVTRAPRWNRQKQFLLLWYLSIPKASTSCCSTHGLTKDSKGPSWFGKW